MFFVLKQNFTHAWGKQAVFWGDTGPALHSRDTKPANFFQSTILAWGTHFSIGGVQALLSGARPQNVPLSRRACPVYMSVKL